MDKVVLCVDGCIGAGKSTLLDIIKTEIGGVLVPEPVEIWKNNGALKRFYGDPKRFAYEFQTIAFVDRINICRKIYKENSTKTNLFILERSIHTDRLFMNILHDDGSVDDVEYDYYHKWCDLHEELMPFDVTHWIYLNPSIDTCMERVKKRGRKEEANLSREYQERLKQEHDKFFNELKTRKNVMYLSTDEDFTKNSEIVDAIHTFVKGGLTPPLQTPP
jgi:deoxyadenosine/deoxycytidine kinase